MMGPFEGLFGLGQPPTPEQQMEHMIAHAEHKRAMALIRNSSSIGSVLASLHRAKSKMCTTAPSAELEQLIATITQLQEQICIALDTQISAESFALATHALLDAMLAVEHMGTLMRMHGLKDHTGENAHTHEGDLLPNIDSVMDEVGKIFGESESPPQQ